jgi:hypothetical protein
VGTKSESVKQKFEIVRTLSSLGNNEGMSKEWHSEQPSQSQAQQYEQQE